MSCALQVPLPGRALPRPRQSHPPLSRAMLLRVVRDDPADPRGARGGGSGEARSRLEVPRHAARGEAEAAAAQQPARPRRAPEIKFALGLLTGVQGAETVHTQQEWFVRGLLTGVMRTEMVCTISA